MNKSIGDIFGREEKFIAWALLAVIPRAFMHYYFFKWNFGQVLIDMYYILVLHFSLLFSIETLSKLFFKIKIADTLNYYQSFIKYWVLVFPFVPLITLITKSSYGIHIETFKYIPTFLVDGNFLPLGMVFVIPIILYCLTQHVMRYTGLNVFKSFLLVAIANTISYLLYYQWTLGLYYQFAAMFTANTAMALFSLIDISILMYITFNLTGRGILSVGWLKLNFFIFYIYGFVLLTQVCKYYMHIHNITL